MEYIYICTFGEEARESKDIEWESVKRRKEYKKEKM